MNSRSTRKVVNSVVPSFSIRARSINPHGSVQHTASPRLNHIWSRTSYQLCRSTGEPVPGVSARSSTPGFMCPATHFAAYGRINVSFPSAEVKTRSFPLRVRDTAQQPSGIRVNKIIDQRIHAVPTVKNKIPVLARSWNLDGESHEDRTVRLRLFNETTAPVAGKRDQPYRLGSLQPSAKGLGDGCTQNQPLNTFGLRRSDILRIVLVGSVVRVGFG